MKLPSEVLDALLACWPVARLATRTPEGAPHALPVVFAASDGQAWVPVDGKRKDGSPLARVRNVKANDRACLLLDHYDADWSRLWWVKLDGRARVEIGAGALAERVGAQLRAKYPQYRDVPVFRSVPTLLVLRWNRVTAWSQAGDVDAIRRSLDDV